MNALRKRAFTLIELLVSLAVIIVALGIVTGVFSITAKTAGQAAAVSETQRYLDSVVENLRADLEHADQNGMLVIHGAVTPAGRTEDDVKGERYLRFEQAALPQLDPTVDPRNDRNLPRSGPGGLSSSGYADPRTDVLMFFTRREQPSAAPPANPVQTTDAGSDPSAFGMARAAEGMNIGLAQITYGHAALQSWHRAGRDAVVSGRPRHIAADFGEISEIPVVDWVLARRALLIDIEPRQDTRNEVLNEFADQLGDVDGPGAAWAIARDPQREAGDIVSMNYPLLIDTGRENSLGRDLLTVSPYTDLLVARRQLIGSTELQDIYDLMFVEGNAADRHVATLVVDPPLELRTNRAFRAVPACAWFQVEFLMPEDPRNARNFVDRRNVDRAAKNAPGDPPRWCQVPPGETYVFGPNKPQELWNLATPDSTAPDANDARVRLSYFIGQDGQRGNVANQFAEVARKNVRLWPYAVRITVKAFDPEGRLEVPLERVVVYRFDTVR